MFKAIWNFFATMFTFGAGKINKASDVWNTDPTVIKEKYKQIMSETAGSIEEMQKALGIVIQLQDSQAKNLKEIHGEIEMLTKRKSAALAMANDRKNILEKSGLVGDALKDALNKDGEYLKCRTAFQDFTSTLESKNQEVGRLDTSVVELGNKIQDYKIRLQKMRAEMDNIKEEQSSTIADIQFAKQRKQIADMESGLQVGDKTSSMRAEIQELRQQAVGSAKAAEIYAGTDAKNIASEFDNYSEQKQAADAFDNLIFKDAQPTVNEQPVGLPEN